MPSSGIEGEATDQRLYGSDSWLVEQRMSEESRTRKLVILFSIKVVGRLVNCIHQGAQSEHHEHQG